MTDIKKKAIGASGKALRFGGFGGFTIVMLNGIDESSWLKVIGGAAGMALCLFMSWLNDRKLSR